MKSYFKIALLLLASIFTTVFVSPILAGIIPFHLYKIMSRVMLVSVFFLFFYYRGGFGFNTIKELGFGFNKRWWLLLLLGFVLGLFSMGIILFVMVQNTIRFVVPDVKSINLIQHLIQYLFAGLVVAFFEEFIFRGFIFQSLLKDTKILFSLFLTSLLYSIVHFFKPIAIDDVKVLSIFASMDAVPRFFSPLFINFYEIWPNIVGLFLVGVVLCMAYMRVRTLALPIGLHAGWILSIKSISLTTDAYAVDSFWLNADITANPITWFVLLILIVVFRWPGYGNKKAAKQV